MDSKLGPGLCHPTTRYLPPYLKGLVSSRSTNPKEAYMRTNCSKRRVSCWEISSNCMEGGRFPDLRWSARSHPPIPRQEPKENGTW